MAARNARSRKQPQKYVPSMTGNKYAVALTQIVALLKGSKHAMSMAQMLVKLTSLGAHKKADVVGISLLPKIIYCFYSFFNSGIPRYKSQQDTSTISLRNFTQKCPVGVVNVYFHIFLLVTGLVTHI
jgi:hypothetical protein